MKKNNSETQTKPQIDLKNLNATQKRIIQSIETGIQLSQLFKEDIFNFPCVNDYCTRTEEDNRVEGLAWKNKSKGYDTFCTQCGQEFRFTQQEFRKIKRKIEHEGALNSMAKNNQNIGSLVKVDISLEFDEYEEEDYDYVAGF